MHPLALIVILVVMASPILYIIGETRGRRSLRIGSIIILLPAAIFTGWATGMLSRFNYNAWYGSSSKSLIDETILQIEAGRSKEVARVLRQLSDSYSPTYENRAHYDELTESAVEEMKSQSETAKK
jgi:hypothetical protein